MGGSDNGRDKVNLNADKIPENAREVVRTLKEIVKYSEQEIYAMLVECNMDADEAINRLLSQDSFQEVKSKRNKKKETKERSDIQRVGSSNQDREFKKGGDYYVGQDNGNKFDSEEPSNVQGIRNHLADSSTTSSILDRHPSLNSDVSNVETKRVSAEAVPSGQTTMADVSKMGLGSSKESVAKASVSDDCLLPENPVFAKSLPDSVIESSARSDQLQESASVSNQNIKDGDNGGSQLLCDNNNKNDETYQEQKRSSEHNQTKYSMAAVNLDQYIGELQHLRFGTFDSGINGLPSQFPYDDSEDRSGSADDLSLSHLNTKDGECQEEEEKQLRINAANEQMTYQINSNCDQSEPTQENQCKSSTATDNSLLSHLNIRDGECHEAEKIRLRTNVANEQMAFQINSNAASTYHSSSNYEQTEPTTAPDFTFDSSHLFNTLMAPSEQSLQMQNFDTFPHAMLQQAYTREPDPRYSASPLDQSMPTASLPSRRLSFPMAKPPLRIGFINEQQMNGQAMNHHHYSQPNVPTGHYGNMVNYPCSLPTQNDTYHMPPPSGFQQNGGSNNNGSLLHSLVASLPQNRNGDLRQPAVATVPSARSFAFGSTNGSAYGSTNGSTYGSAYGSTSGSATYDSTNGSTYGSTNSIGMLSDNTANSMYGCEEDYQSRVNKLFASLWHQNVNSKVLAPQGHNDSGSNSYSLHTGHQNHQQFPSVRYSQQEQPNRGIGYEFESSRRYNASLEQQNNRRDPSNQTQQQSWPRNNYESKPTN